MRIHVETRWQWDNERTEYVKVYDSFYDYTGPVDLMCGASSEEKGIAQQQSNVYNQLTSQAKQVFGGASQVFQSLVNTFTPTVQAGPNQQGFSPAELSALNSQAITGVGTAYKNAKAALGNQQAAVGGGNVTLPSGVNQANDLGLAEGAANATSNSLNQITQENYAVGRQNYSNAVKGLSGATDVFNPAATAANAATNAGNAASNSAHNISQEHNSWVNAALGALGSVAGAATGGLLKGFGGVKGAASNASTSVGTGNDMVASDMAEGSGGGSGGGYGDGGWG